MKDSYFNWIENDSYTDKMFTISSFSEENTIYIFSYFSYLCFFISVSLSLSLHLSLIYLWHSLLCNITQASSFLTFKKLLRHLLDVFMYCFVFVRVEIFF